MFVITWAVERSMEGSPNCEHIFAGTLGRDRSSASGRSVGKHLLVRMSYSVIFAHIVERSTFSVKNVARGLCEVIT